MSNNGDIVRIKQFNLIYDISIYAINMEVG